MAPLTAARHWEAPTAASPVKGVVSLPGSKSLTNRALILAALCESPTTIRRPLRARDSILMAEALRAIGVVVDDVGHRDWLVVPGALRGPARINCGLAGTVMRFLPPVAALAQGDVTFDGDEQARTRPMSPVLDALRDLGAEVDSAAGGSEGTGPSLPFTIRGQGSLPGGVATLDASLSSQFISGLLLAGPKFEEGLTVRHIGPPVPSLPHIAMTLAMLADAGAVVRVVDANEWNVAPGPLSLGEVDIEPDLSNAAAYLAAAVVTGGEVSIPHWPERSTQPGLLLPLLLERMGAHTSLQEGTLTVSGTGRVLGLDEDLRDVGELVPVLAAVSALAETPSRLRGIAHLRGHETDRLSALRQELHNLGGVVEELPDELRIAPAPLHGGVFETYSDHRMATAGAVLGLRVPGVRVVDIDTTDKTLPGFAESWHSLLAGGTA